jgi:hypothetical protein
MSQLKFIKETSTIYAVLQNEVYKGKMCEEVMFAEIDKVQGGFKVIWEDSHKEPHLFQELADAKQYVMLEYPKHNGFINGKTWEVEDE